MTDKIISNVTDTMVSDFIRVAVLVVVTSENKLQINEDKHYQKIF